MTKRYGVTLPSTLEKSPDKAQRTYAKTLRNAEQTYGPGERAGRTAYASLKHGFEKVDDHWVPKEGRHAGNDTHTDTDTGRGPSREALYARARALGIPGRARMNKAALAQAIAKRQ